MKSPPEPFSRSPWEVIERIIGHCNSCDIKNTGIEILKNSESIFNFSLTCRQLRPRSLCFLVAHPVFSSRSKIFDFCDFLQVKPYLKPFVRSIAVFPSDFAPVPLLRILPNLSEVKFTDIPPVYGYKINTLLHPSTLTCCQFLSTHVQTLCLHRVSFKTELQFLHVLLAFPNISHLVCFKVFVNKEGDRGFINMGKQRLSQRLRLRTLITDDSGTGLSTAMLLLGWEWVQSTLESLTVQANALLRLSPWRSPSWCQLQYLKLKVGSSESKESEEITSLIAFLQLDHITPKEVVVEIYERDLLSVRERLAQNADLYQQLESTLLRFSQPQLIWIMNIFPIGRFSFWIQELENRFPELLQRGALLVVSNPVLRSGYTRRIKTIVISPDNKWVASASTNGTVIISDITNGAEVQRWNTYDLQVAVIPFLAFSSDSQYLASCYEWTPRITVWNIHGGRPEVVQVERHAVKVIGCAWSPVGDLIVYRLEDGTVCLWDAKRFRPLYEIEHRNVQLIKFSPNGRWIITGSHRPFSYYLWDVVLGTGRIICMPAIDPYGSETAVEWTHGLTSAAFDPGSTRVAITSPRLEGRVEILEMEDVEGSPPVVLGASESRLDDQRIMHVAFSPDGNLVLTVPDHRVSTQAVKIWDAYTGVEVWSLKGHREWLKAACFSPCGRFVASASADRTVRLWSTRDGSCLATLTEHNAPVLKVVFSPDGKTLVSGAEDGSVIIHRMCDILPIDEPGPAATRT